MVDADAVCWVEGISVDAVAVCRCLLLFLFVVVVAVDAVAVCRCLSLFVAVAVCCRCL